MSSGPRITLDIDWGVGGSPTGWADSNATMDPMATMVRTRTRMISLVAVASLIAVGCGSAGASPASTSVASGATSATSSAGGSADKSANDLTGIEFEVRRDPG